MNNNIKPNTPAIENEQILDSIQKWIITLWEVVKNNQKKLENTLLKDVPNMAFPMIKKLRDIPNLNSKKHKRYLEIEEYFENTSSFRNNYSWKNRLDNNNWRQYLILGEDDILEVVEQKWDVYIAWHPVKQIYTVYKFLWEKFDQNTSLLWWLRSIKKTNIEWYYKISNTQNRKWYYFIWNQWDVTNFWNYRDIGDLQKHWKSVFFKWFKGWLDSDDDIVVHNWDKVKRIPAWFENTRNSQSGRNLLYIMYNYGKPYSTYSLFDLDKMEFVFEWAIEHKFDVNFPECNVWIFSNRMEYTMYE